MTARVVRATEQDVDTSPWWRQPYCWLVISGPLLVVIAALTSVVVAYRCADPVVPEYLSQHMPKELDPHLPVSMRPAEGADVMPHTIGAGAK